MVGYAGVVVHDIILPNRRVKLDDILVKVKKKTATETKLCFLY